MKSNKNRRITRGGAVKQRTAYTHPRFELLEDRRMLAGVPTLLKDIAPGPTGSFPSDFIEVGSLAYFTAEDGVTGLKLWKSNGTAAGTTSIKDLSSNSSGLSPIDLANVNGTLFFTADNGGSGFGLWKSDGTTNGTTLVKAVGPGSGSLYPRHLTNVNGTLFFAADDGVNGLELWKSDGTSTGTTLVKNINSGTNSSFPNNLTNVNGTLFFSANNGTNGSELWRSDGTSTGTTLVRDIHNGSSSSYPTNLTNVNGTLFFTADDGSNGVELWRSNGTFAGTTLVQNIHLGNISSYPASLTNVNGTLFFSSNDGTNGTELWRSDGTSTGTTLVKDISSNSGSSYPFSLTNVNGTLFFSARDANGAELWKSDGTPAGTVLVKDILTDSRSSYPVFLTNVNGTLYFQADNGINGQELWQSDGTSSGTVLVNDIRVGGRGSYPAYLTNVNGSLFFAAFGAQGDEPWILRPPLSNSTLAIAATSADKAEGNAGTTLYTFTVTRSGALTGTTTVNYTVTGIGARPATASDFVGNALPSGVVTFTAGQTSRVITVRVRGDATAEANETFRVTLSGASAGTTIATAAANGTIRNDDTSLAIAATSADKAEGNAGTTLYTFTVTRSGVLTGTTTVNYAVVGVGASPATASDFVGNAFPSGTVTFAAGQVTRVITIPVRGDATVESNETFRVTLSGASAGTTIATAIANGTIRNDDTSLAIAATSADKVEGNSGTNLFTFTVTRSGLLTGTTTVDYAVAGIGASPAAASDFVGNVLPTGTVTFAPGDTTKVISIRVRGDVTVEANEAFRVSLSNPSLGASITTAFASGLIRNDD